jgi:Ser/Thr protein kinase RdoA (MazF antagonist)
VVSTPRTRATGRSALQFESDNLAWARGRPVVYDLDEATISWFAADIVYAVRDPSGPTGCAAAEHRLRLDAFIAGYCSLRPLDDQGMARLPLFAGLQAAASLVRVRRAMGGRAGFEPSWLAHHAKECFSDEGAGDLVAEHQGDGEPFAGRPMSVRGCRRCGYVPTGRAG